MPPALIAFLAAIQAAIDELLASVTPVSTTAPSVDLVADPPTITTAGPVLLTVTASDDVGVTSLLLYRGDALIAKLPNTGGIFTDQVNGSVGNSVKYRAVARNAANKTGSKELLVVINIPATPPASAATISNDGDAFVLAWPPVQNATEYVVQRAYGATGREFTPVNMNRLTATTYRDDTVYDGRAVWYRVMAVVGGAETQTAALNGVQPDRVWTDPVTLGSGTYTGLTVRSTTGDAVSLTYRADVILLSCRIAAAGHAVSGFQNKIKGRDNRLWSLMPPGANKLHGKAWNAEEMVNLDIENNFQEGFLTTEGKDYRGDRTASQTYNARYNIVRNVQGRRTNGTGGYQDYTSANGNDQTFYRAQAFLLNGVTGLVGGKIDWNSIYNEPGFSRPEDNINTFGSSGSAGSPFSIRNNHVHGAYPAFPWDTRSTYYTGGGIISGDVGSGYIQKENNLIGACSNYGLGSVGGNDNTGISNVIRRAARSWNGQRIVCTNFNAIQYYDYNGAGKDVFRNNTVANNSVGVEYENAAGQIWKNSVTANAQNIAGANNTYSGTTFITEPITYMHEYALWQMHRDMAFVAGVTIGPRATA